MYVNCRLFLRRAIQFQVKNLGSQAQVFHKHEYKLCPSVIGRSLLWSAKSYIVTMVFTVILFEKTPWLHNTKHRIVLNVMAYLKKFAIVLLCVIFIKKSNIWSGYLDFVHVIASLLLLWNVLYFYNPYQLDSNILHEIDYYIHVLLHKNTKIPYQLLRSMQEVEFWKIPSWWSLFLPPIYFKLLYYAPLQYTKTR